MFLSTSGSGGLYVFVKACRPGKVHIPVTGKGDWQLYMTCFIKISNQIELNIKVVLCFVDWWYWWASLAENNCTLTWNFPNTIRDICHLAYSFSMCGVMLFVCVTINKLGLWGWIALIVCLFVFLESTLSICNNKGTHYSHCYIISVIYHLSFSHLLHYLNFCQI